MGPSESVLFLTGGAPYLDDVRDPRLNGAATAVFVRSVVAHARFTVDVSPARSAPGVLAAMTAEDNPIWPTGPHAAQYSLRFSQPLLAEHKVRFVGEPIAVVVAETREQALDAAELVEVDYQPLAPVTTIADALRDDVLLFEAGSECRRTGASAGQDLGSETNVMLTAADDGVESDHDPEPFDSAEVLITQTFVNPRQVAAPIECRGAAAAWSADDHIHLWVSTQTPHSLRNRIAPMYGLSPAHIHVIAGPFVGGGFGGKGSPGPEEQLIPHLAHLAGRPVRWIESRSENLTAAPQGRSEELRISLAGSRSGNIEALRVVLRKDGGAYPSAGAGLPTKWSQPIASGNYRIPHVEFDSIAVATNAPPVSALRGAGRAPMIAALERAVDLYAAEIGIDPAEVRRRNLVPSGAMPYTAPSGFVYDESDYIDALDRVMSIGEYNALRAEQRRRRATGDNLQLGIGLASYVHRTNGGSTEEVIVSIEQDGSATVVTGTTSQGHGHATTWAKIASAELGIPVDRIRVVEGVTDAVATGIGAVGSRSAQTAGAGIHVAAREVVAAAKSLVADHFEASIDDVVLDLESGFFQIAGTPSTRIGWADLAVRGLQQDEPLSCDHVYDPNGRDVYPSGCHLAAVEVDIATGAWKLIRFAAVDDAGIRIDSDIVDGQLHGGIALGVAQVMGEEIVFDDDGNPRTGSFLDYQVITIDQLCQIDLDAQVVASSVNEHGYKAVGESGPIGATPAVHNAVLDAIRHIGVDHIDLPCTPQKIWRALNPT